MGCAANKHLFMARNPDGLSGIQTVIFIASWESVLPINGSASAQLHIIHFLWPFFIVFVRQSKFGGKEMLLFFCIAYTACTAAVYTVRALKFMGLVTF